MKKSPVSDRMAKVEKRYGATLGDSKGSKPAPKAKVRAKPMGGLNPHGIKVTWTKKF